MEARRLNSSAKDWLRERKAILNKVKEQVQLYTGPEPEDITLYGRAYHRDLERAWQPSEHSELMAALKEAQVVFGGDFHPFAQAQRSHLRLLRNLDKKGGENALALEVFPANCQESVDLFLAGDLTEAEFLQKVQWDKNWGFPWSHYRPIVEFARKNQMRIIALNQSSSGASVSLEQRDQFAAKKIHSFLQEGTEFIYVIFGDLHIAQEHLPKSFLSLYRENKPKTISLYLNPEKVYFQLARKGMENKVEVVKFNQKHFAIIGSPPWVKWQNYLMYLEDNYDYSFEVDVEEDEWDDFEVDFTDHVVSLVKMISGALDIEVDYNDIEVYSSKEALSIERARDVVGEKFFRFVRFLIKNDSSFYIPSSGFFYLSKPSVNHAASLAAQYVHAKIGQRTELLWNFPENFLNLIWLEAMGFFLSKFVNPKRKSETLGGLKKKLAVFQPNDEGREPLLLALDQKMSELLQVYSGKDSQQKFRPRRKSSYIEAARFLGGMLGERYFLLYHKGRIQRDEVLALLSFHPSDSRIAEFYYNQLMKLDKLELEDGDFE